MTGAGLVALATLALAAPAALRIEPAPLARCLEQLTLATGARFIVATGVAPGVRCRAVAAAPSIDAALDAALEGEPVRWRLRDDGVYLLVPGGAATEATLEPLTIETQEDARDLAEASSPLPGPRPRVADLRSETRYAPEDLAVKPFARFGQLGRLAPNVYGSGEALSIRGVPRDNDYFSGVAVFYDGIDVGTLLLDNDVLAVDDLDSLRYGRGASAFLHGGGSAGGAIYLDTPPPTPVLAGRVRASAGQRSSRSFGAAVSGPLGGGLSARLAVTRAEDPRYVVNRTVTAIDGDTDTRERVLAKLLYEPDALPGLTLAANAFHVDAETPDRFVARRTDDPPSAIFDEVSYDPTARDWRLDALGLGWRAEYRFDGGLELGLHASDLDAERSAAQAAEAALRTTRQDREQRTRYGAQLAWPIRPAWRVHAAVEAQRIETDRGLLAETLTAGTWIRQRDNTVLRVDGVGTSLELAYDRGARWRALAGVRRIDEDVRFLTTRERAGVDAQALVDTRSSYARTLPAAGLEFDPTPSQHLALRYDRGYRTGGRSEIEYVGEYAPEALETAELAWRTEALGGRLHVTTSVFRTDWRDRTSIDGTIGANVTEPIETRIRGGEIEARFAVHETLDLRLGVGYLDSEYTRGRFITQSTAFDLRGQRGADAPRATAICSIAWRGRDGWFATIDAYHARTAASSAFAGVLAPQARDAYAVIDARLGWRHRNLTIALDVGNALDEHYIDRFVERRARSRRIGAPRQTELSVAWSF